MSNCVFNFNILAQVLSGILGWSQIYIRGPCAPQRPPSKKILTCAQVLAYIYIIVNFQLRISIHAGLTERSLYNRFALKNLPKWGFWGIFFGGEGLRYLVGTPLGMQWPPIYVVWWKNYYCKYPSLYTRQRNYKKTLKKRNVYAVRVIFHPCAALTPLNP